MVVAAITGYFAIDALVRLLGRSGLAPFAIYCVGFGTISLFLV
jgi:undecaprenyl pyrophosphate phosphatase UppP